MNLSYELWDVFTDVAFAGNPLALVPDAAPLSDEQMQKIAQEFNLSETSFVLPSEVGDVRARYFTPRSRIADGGASEYRHDLRAARSGKG